MTPDPIKLAGGLNFYQYVDGNPVGWVDPLGLDGMPGFETEPTGNRTPEPKIQTQDSSIKVPSTKLDKQIAALRSGKDVRVKTVEEAREILDNMPELKAGGGGDFLPTARDPMGTYRGDLIDITNPANNKGVHDKGPHKDLAHFNLTIRVEQISGSVKRLKPAIFIDGD